MPVRFPPPLRPGDRIGVTSPSSGIGPPLWPRLEAGLDALRVRGYDVVVGECLDGTSHVSDTKQRRAAELTAMLADPSIRAVVPPWGGETAIDLLDQLDWDRLAALEPTWVVGYSDTTTWMLPLTLRLGWATLHGGNLMDTPYRPPPGLAHWTELAAATSPVAQRSPCRYRSAPRADWEGDPAMAELDLDREGSWSLLDPARGPVDVRGRLLGACIDTLTHLAGTAYADLPAFSRAHAEDGMVVYVEACDYDAFSVCRALHGMRYAGWFDAAHAVLVGRTRAPDSDTLTQHEAVADALGMLDVPVVLDVVCGHVPPSLPLVNGALARVVLDGDRRKVVQELR